MMNSNWITGMFHDRTSAERAVDAIMRAGYRPEDVSVVMSDEARNRHFGASGAGSTMGATGGMGNAGHAGHAHGNHGNHGRDPSLNDPNKEGRLAEGVGVGSMLGASVGAVLAGIAAVGTSLLVPGLGLIVAGPIAAGLAGAGAGGATGGLIGGLVNAGVPEAHARHYESGLQRGGILVAVKARSDEHAAQLRRWFDEAGADNVHAGNAT